MTTCMHKLTTAVTWLMLCCAVMAQAPKDQTKTDASKDEVKKESPKDRAKLELSDNGIRLIHKNKFFYGPYKVQSGDTFASLSEKFYKTKEYAAILSEINGLSPTEPLAPGSTVYISFDSVSLRFPKEQKESQYEIVKKFLGTVTDAAQLTYVWDEADMSMELSHEGKWILSKYESAKLRIFDPVAEKPELELKFRKKPVLDILFSTGTLITSAALKP